MARRPYKRRRLDLSALSRFGFDERGVAAVEFALIAPVLIAMYLGLAEVCQAYMAQKRASHVTSQVADIVAQTDVMTRDDIADVFGIGALVLTPFPSAPLTMRVTSITRGADGVARVDWSRGQGMTGRSGTVAVPAGLIANGESIIMSEANYAYRSPLAQLLPGITNFSSTYWLRPRQVDRVGCSDC